MNTAIAFGLGIVAWLAISFLVARGFGRFMRHCDRVDAEEEWTPRGWQVHPVTTVAYDPDTGKPISPWGIDHDRSHEAPCRVPCSDAAGTCDERCPHLERLDSRR